MTDAIDFDGALRAAQRGDDQAMEVLFRELHPRVLRFVGAHEPRVADDLVGEVWMAVAQRLSGFEGDAPAFRAWVFSIARRRIADHRRTSIRRRTDPTAPDGFTQMAAEADVEQHAVDRLDGSSAAQLVTRLLPADQAEVVLLRVLADLGVDEVAEIVGRTANWVRVTQHRALRRLADRLGEKMAVIR